MSWWRTEVNRLREENEAVKNLASALHERLWEVETERDAVVARAEHRRAAAVARADQLRDERDDALSAGLEALGDAERDRDEWKARAEAAEARLADPYSQANQDAAAWDRVAAHPALRMELLPDVEGSYADCVFERITWLAEVEEAVTEMKPAVDAEARTTPAVPLHQPDGTRMDASHLPIGADDDPAVFVVRESDIEDCQRNEDGDWEFRHSGR